MGKSFSAGFHFGSTVDICKSIKILTFFLNLNFLRKKRGFCISNLCFTMQCKLAKCEAQKNASQLAVVVRIAGQKDKAEFQIG